MLWADVRGKAKSCFVLKCRFHRALVTGVQVIERYELPVRLTANQNLILLDVDPAWKTDIATTLGAHLHAPTHKLTPCFPCFFASASTCTKLCGALTTPVFA